MIASRLLSTSVSDTSPGPLPFFRDTETMIRNSTFVFVLLTLSPVAAVAQQTSDDATEGPWSGSAEVSLVATSGNSDTRTLGLGGEVGYAPGGWSWLARLSYVESESDDLLKARSQSVVADASRAFSSLFEVYGQGGYLQDRFAGIERRLTVEGGLAYRVGVQAPHALRFRGGFGFTRETRSAGRDLLLPTANLSARYRWTITRTSSLTSEATIVADLNSGDDRRLTNELAAAAALSTRLSLKVSHKLSYLNAPVPGFEKTDTILSTALVANF